MRVLRKLMAEVSPASVFAGWADDRGSARRLIADVAPALLLTEVELADGKVWDVLSGFRGFVIPICESMADRGQPCAIRSLGWLVKPVSAGDLGKIMFHLK